MLCKNNNKLILAHLTLHGLFCYCNSNSQKHRSKYSEICACTRDIYAFTYKI